MVTLSDASGVITTSQNRRLVLRPVPNSDAHVMSVDIFRAACGAEVARDCANRRCDDVATAIIVTHRCRPRTGIGLSMAYRAKKLVESRSTLARYPERIVCLTEETTETLYRIGAGDRVVGVSGYTVRQVEARQKPKVSAFLNARLDKIEALRPDLVLAFSDLQADIVSALIRRGLTVVAFNQRSVAEILQMIRMLGGLIGLDRAANAFADELASGLDAIRRSAARWSPPRVYFEEWYEPLISGIRWVEELVEIAGGRPIFPHLRDAALGKDRIVAPEAVIAARPEIIVASWCGKKVRKVAIAERPHWRDLPAVADGRIYEIKSTYILQPGPASLTEGVRQLHALFAQAAGVEVDSTLRPAERLDREPYVAQ